MARSAQSPFVILGVLATDGPLSGYEVRKWIEQSIAYFWSESFGQIYPVLADLARRGWIAPAAEQRAGGRERKRYRITPAGRRALRDWLSQPAQPQPPRLEYLVKLFFGPHAAPDACRAHLEQVRAQNLARAAELTRIEQELSKAAAGAGELPYWLMTLRHGLRMCDARARWADDALELLTHSAGAGRPGQQGADS